MKKTMFYKMLLCTSLFFACSNDNDSYQVKFNETEFKQQRTLWEEQRLRNYSYDYSYGASTGPVQMAIVVSSGVPSTSSEYEQAYTIDEIFQKIQNDYNQALTQDSSGKLGVNIEVSYNKEYHYPEIIKYSTSYKSSDIAGGASYELRIRNFTINN